MTDLIIPGLILGCFVLIIVHSCMIVSGKKSREEEQRERETFSHPSMDLRIPDDPCDSCPREPECMGVDQPYCERYNAMKSNVKG